MNQSKDNLEDFFQQSFNDEEKVNQIGDWNSPSEEVWGKIQDGLTEEKRFNVLLLKWPWSAIAASYLLMVSGYQFFHIKQAPSLINEPVVIEQFQRDEVVVMAAVSPAANARYSKSPDLERLSTSSPDDKINRAAGRQETTSILISSLETRNIGNIGTRNIGTGFDFGNQPVEIYDNKTLLEKDRIATPMFLTLKNNELATDFRSLPATNLTLPKTKKSNNYLAVNYAPVVEKLKSKAPSKRPNQSANGYSIGFQVGRENAKGWAVETGAQYTKMDEQIVNTSNREQVSMAPKTYLEVPIMVKKSWKKGKLEVGVKTGLVNRFEMNQAIASNNDAMLENRNLPANKYLPSLLAGVEVAYAVKPNLSVYVAPTVTKGIRPIIDVEGMELTAQNLMVQVGVRYEL